MLAIWRRDHGPAALQVLLFSATLHSPEVREIAERVCYQPIWIDQKARTVLLLTSGFWACASRHVKQRHTVTGVLRCVVQGGVKFCWVLAHTHAGFKQPAHSRMCRNAGSGQQVGAADMCCSMCANPNNNPSEPLTPTQGRESVPDTVDHVQVRVDPREDRSWLQAEPRVPTDNAHAFDAVGPQHDTPENWSEAVKRLKPRVLQRLLDVHKCAHRFHTIWLSVCSSFLPGFKASSLQRGAAGRACAAFSFRCRECTLTCRHCANRRASHSRGRTCRSPVLCWAEALCGQQWLAAQAGAGADLLPHQL